MLIIDTDPGVDDAFALAVALSRREEVAAISCTFGNASVLNTHRNARVLTSLFGAANDVEVFSGASRPFGTAAAPGDASHVHGHDGFSGLGRTSSGVLLGRPPNTTGAIDALRHVLETSTEPVDLVALGPLTNCAALLREALPTVRSKLRRVVVLGGAIERGNVTPYAEFNFWCDPHSADFVLRQAEVPVLLVPIDLTLAVAGFTQQFLERLRAVGEAGAFLEQLALPLLQHYRRSIDRDVVVLHDIVATLEALNPGSVRTRPVCARVRADPGPEQGQLRLRAPSTSDGEPGGDSTIEIAESLSPEVDLETILTRSVEIVSKFRSTTSSC
ncbi:nucleoside hydrolase [Pseudonocardia sp. EV170527-09]|uniref:nucleoside hydrolase n=1 Tax=Pseudonocardia sp. EV170527-09 TaxID=2603411 RepID=UPI0011F3809D|nr:nucleoside hydrolase [Pseudonocardia sp. EV170527-09]KAA1027864.1 nucleoside hydrolase [Pseudonocardia sp. EV170527-09]